MLTISYFILARSTNYKLCRKLQRNGQMKREGSLLVLLALASLASVGANTGTFLIMEYYDITLYSEALKYVLNLFNLSLSIKFN